MQERNRLGSVDDLVGGLLSGRSLNGLAAFPRTDSESAFQEFLKRIPSSSNLAAVNATLDNGTKSAQLQYQIGQAVTSIPAAPIIDVNAVSAAGVGLPRVPSLDFLRQLASAQQLASVQMGLAPAGIKMEGSGAVPTTGPLPLPALSAVDLANLNTSALTSALHTVPLSTVAPHLALQNSAALHMQQQQQQQPQQQQFGATQSQAKSGVRAHSNGPANSEATSPSSNERGGDGGDKTESRKARRMLSNRESARRSRRRKQEHLSKLEQEINVMMEEKRAWTEQVTALEKRCTTVTDENRRLKEENERLRDELQFLRSELKERNNYARRSEEREDNGNEPNGNSKRQRAEQEAGGAGSALKREPGS